MMEKQPTHDCLTIADLSEVQRYFWNVRACWKSIGSELGVDQGSISAFERTYKGFVDDCLLEVLKTWLRQTNCSRHKMKKVLQSPMVLQAIQDSKCYTRKRYINWSLLPSISFVYHCLYMQMPLLKTDLLSILSSLSHATSGRLWLCPQTRNNGLLLIQVTFFIWRW